MIALSLNVYAFTFFGPVDFPHVTGTADIDGEIAVFNNLISGREPTDMGG